MFTKEFVIELSALQEKNKKAIEALKLLKSLNIINRAVEDELNNIKSRAFVKDMFTTNYILSFLPEEVLQIVGFSREFVSTCTTYSCNERVVLDTSLLIGMGLYRVSIVFDYEHRCCYLKNDRIEENLLKELTKYIEVAPEEFNHYIEYSLD